MRNRNSVSNNRIRNSLAPLGVGVALLASGPALAGLYAPADTTWISPLQPTEEVRSGERAQLPTTLGQGQASLLAPADSTWLGPQYVNQSWQLPVEAAALVERTVLVQAGISEVRVPCDKNLRFVVQAAGGAEQVFEWRSPTFEQVGSVELREIAPAELDLPAGVQVLVEPYHGHFHHG